MLEAQLQRSNHCNHRWSYHLRSRTIYTSSFSAFLQLGRVPCRAASIWTKTCQLKASMLGMWVTSCRQKLHCVKTHRWELRVLFVQINATFEHVLGKLLQPPGFLSGSDWDSSETVGNWSGEEELWSVSPNYVSLCRLCNGLCCAVLSNKIPYHPWSSEIQFNDRDHITGYHSF